MPEAFWVIALTIPAVTVFAAWWVSEEQRIRRALKRVPRRAIRDARAGEVVKLIGKVAPVGALLDAPLVLEAGDRVAVLGEARWERDPDAPGGDDAPKRLVIDAHDGAVVVRAARKAT